MRVRLRPGHALALLTMLAGATFAQPLPEDELQVALSTYGDSFGLTVVYPSVSITRRVGADTSVSGRYLVDAVTSASMKSRIPVDGVTSATHRTHGGAGGTFDEVRHEVGAGVAHAAGELLLTTDALWSREHDYRSFTLASSGTYALAARNTELQLSLVRSWDEIFPVTRSWRRDKNVLTLSAGITQTIGARAIAQAELSYSALHGFLSDAYQVVSIVDSDALDVDRFEPRHPGTRFRRAVGLRANLSTTRHSSLGLGYRYYSDTWDVRSHTVSGLFQHHFFGDELTLGLGLRTYQQTSAEFFQPVYDEPQRYMTVDDNLDSSHSLEYQVRARLSGALVSWVPGLDRTRTALTARISYYHRRTTTPGWHSRRSALDAIVTSVAVRVRL